MKICPNCQAVQQDNRNFCVDCGAKLGKKISRAEENSIRQKMDHQIEKLYRQKDPLDISGLDRIGGILGLIFVAAMVIAWIILGNQRETGIWPLAGILFGLCGIAEAFFPKIGWELEKFRLSFWANGADDLTPSTFYRWSRKIVIWLGVVLSAAVFFTLIFESGEPQAPPEVLLPY